MTSEAMTKPHLQRGERHLRVLVYANVDRAEIGGVQSVVRSLRDHLLARDHTVMTGWSGSTDGLTDAGADGWVEQFPVLSGPRWLHLRTLARVIVRLLRARPNVVSIHFASASTRYFNFLAPILGFRVLLTCHGSDMLRTRPEDVAHISSVLRGAAAITAVSEDIGQQIVSKNNGLETPIAVIANGIDTEFWKPPQTSRASGPQVLAAIGRLAPVKGFDVLIDALDAARRKGAEARLVLIGDGPERQALEAQAERLGISASVEFTGPLVRHQIRERLHAADLFVMPSRSEGMPLALLEAMASGTPVLASRVGGVPHVAGGCGVLVEPEDRDALSDALVAFLADSDARLRLAQQARVRAQDFSIERSHRAYEEQMLALL